MMINEYDEEYNYDYKKYYYDYEDNDDGIFL
jgi:hypothetical protein